MRVTNREVYDRLGAVEAKLDDALLTIRSQNTQLLDYGKRIRSLELRFYGVIAGFISAGTVVVFELVKAKI